MCMLVYGLAYKFSEIFGFAIIFKELYLRAQMELDKKLGHQEYLLLAKRPFPGSFAFVNLQSTIVPPRKHARVSGNTWNIDDFDANPVYFLYLVYLILLKGYGGTSEVHGHKRPQKWTFREQQIFIVPKFFVQFHLSAEKCGEKVKTKNSLFFFTIVQIFNWSMLAHDQNQ